MKKIVTKQGVLKKPIALNDLQKLEKVVPELIATQKVNSVFIKAIGKEGEKFDAVMVKLNYKPPPPPPTVMMDKLISLLPKFISAQKAEMNFIKGIIRAAKKWEVEINKIAKSPGE
jgi:hypothetical protein